MILVRKAVPGDAPAITGFQEKMALETEELVLEPSVVEEGVKAVFRNEQLGTYWVAEENGEVVGSLLITYEWSDWRNKIVWWIQSVYIMPGHRKKGIFKSLYRHVSEESEKNNAAGLRLYVEKSNFNARHAYESLGMVSEHYLLYEWMKE
jgi:GNAT superfamily N-acetyltransferase